MHINNYEHPYKTYRKPINNYITSTQSRDGHRERLKASPSPVVDTTAGSEQLPEMVARTGLTAKWGLDSGTGTFSL